MHFHANLAGTLISVVTAKRLHQDRRLSIDQICKTLGISRPTFYRYLALTDAAAKGPA